MQTSAIKGGAIQYANRHCLTGVPIRESRFFGTATNVEDYKDWLNQENGSYSYQGKSGITTVDKSIISSAVHESDFVGLTPLLLLRSKYLFGGNKTTGGQSGWFTYSHGSYFGEVPNESLINDNGDYINKSGVIVPEKFKVKNDYWDDFKEKWEPTKSNLNPSLPIQIK